MALDWSGITRSGGNHEADIRKRYLGNRWDSSDHRPAVVLAHARHPRLTSHQGEIGKVKVLGLTPTAALVHIHTRLSVHEFEQWCKLHRKPIGTGWYEALDTNDKNALQGQRWDPYGSNDWRYILVALKFLQNPEFPIGNLVSELYGNPLMKQ